MSDLPMIAATEWAKANAAGLSGPDEFGRCVAKVYVSCLKELGGLSFMACETRPVSAVPTALEAKAIEQLIEVQKACASALVAEIRVLHRQLTWLANDLTRRP